jgi:hypothetical protein
MKNGMDNRFDATPVELAIVAKWTLQEAWLACIDTLDRKLRDQLLSPEKKDRLQAMYTAFFSQAFYSAVKTRSDIDELVKNSRKMLLMLKDLDKTAWESICNAASK